MLRPTEPGDAGEDSAEAATDLEEGDTKLERCAIAVTQKVPTSELQANVKLIDTLVSCHECLADEDGLAHLSEVHRLVCACMPSFDSRNFGYKKLSDFMRATDKFEVRTERVVRRAMQCIHPMPRIGCYCFAKYQPFGCCCDCLPCSRALHRAVQYGPALT